MKRFFLFLFLFIFPFTAFGSSKFYISGLAVSDMYVGSQWYLEKIHATDAWMETQGGKDVVVAIIDTGIDLDHPDLAPNLWINEKEIPDNGIDDDNNGYVDDIHGWDFVDNDATPTPHINTKYTKVAVDHGTAIAGIISGVGNNAFAGAGVSWNTSIMPLRVFNDIGEANAYLVEAAIRYAVDNGADIINMSFVGFGHTQSFEETIKYAYEKGVLLVAAAGNETGATMGHNFSSQKSYPVCYTGLNGENWVLGVVALDENDKKARFSNYGADCSDISAPGTNIYSSLYYDSSDKDFSKYFGGKFNGSSMAAPQVVGAAALIKHLHPNYTNKQLTEVLLDSVDNIDGANVEYINELGRGRLNVLRAVKSPPISMESSEESVVKYVLSALPGDKPKIWLLNSKGDVIREFYAFAPSFRGGLNVSLGDVDNDGSVEIVVGAGSGGGPHVRIFNLKGELENQFFAFDSNRRNGVIVGVGDIKGDNRNEIIALEAGNSKVEAKILDVNGNEESENIILLDKIVNNPVSLSLADINKDGRDEIIIGSAFGQKDGIKIFNYKGEMINNFFPYGNYFSGGIRLTADDLNNDGWAEIIAGKASGNDHVIKTYNAMGKLLSPGFLAYANYGFGLASGDKGAGDGEYEIITASREGDYTEIKVWDKDLNKQVSFYPFGKDVSKNVNAYIVTRYK